MKLYYMAIKVKGNKKIVKSVIVPNYEAFEFFIDLKNKMHSQRNTGFVFISM